jgi:hypothetical protein
MSNKKVVPKFTQEQLDEMLGNDFVFPDDLDNIHPPQPTKEEEIERLEKLVQIQYEQIQSLKEINNVLMGIKKPIQ